MPSSDSERLARIEEVAEAHAERERSREESPLVEPAQPSDSAPLLRAIAELDIEFDCRGCGRPGRVPRAWAGGRVRCAGCRQPIRLPSERTAGFRPDPGTASFGRIRRRLLPRDPQHEAHLRAIAGWYQAIGLLGALVLPVFTRELGLQVSVLAVLGAVLVWFTGQLLWRYREAGRWGSACLAVGFTFGVAVGAVEHALVPGALAVLASGGWAAATVWALFGRAGGDVFCPAYREAVEHGGDRRVPWRSSPFFYLPAGLLLGSAAGAWLLL
jgi:hypothetical protein